jgi:enoyl-CoA hydratase/carnithine racemase
VSLLVETSAAGVRTITLNRPEKLNAVDAALASSLPAAIDDAARTDHVRVVVITGAGRGFCSGLDLTSPPRLPESTRVDRLDPIAWVGRWVLSLVHCEKPVIAAINGAAVGIGATMTLGMDIRMASTEARIGFVFGRIGITPEAASSWFLPRIVGLQQALEWIYAADILTAEAALTGRLLRSVHPPEELVPAAQELARSFVKGRSPIALGLSKRLLYRHAGSAEPLEAHLSDSLAVYWTSLSDGKEGVAAFLEKRPASFTGKASELPRID